MKSKQSILFLFLAQRRQGAKFLKHSLFLCASPFFRLRTMSHLCRQNRMTIWFQQMHLGIHLPLHPLVCVSSANGNPVHHLIFQIVFKHFVPACDRSPEK